MNFPVPTADAKAQGLQGSDTYRRSAYLYLDDLHRNWGAVGLVSEAVRAFGDTIAITNREALAQHRDRIQEWIAKGALAAGLDMPWDEAWHDAMEYSHYEHLKLACGFELCLKARLLASGILVHVIDAVDTRYKSLAREQYSRPISVAEVLAIQPYQFDGTINFLPGITPRSLKFSWITDEKAYRAATGLSDQALDIIKDYRELRNVIHLPGESPDTPAIRAFGKPMIEFLLPFLNGDMIDWANTAIDSHGLNFRRIAHFS